MPKLLRQIFQRNPHLVPNLFHLAYESLTEYLRSLLHCNEGIPGIIIALHTFGEFLDFHPHIHAVVADGLFIRTSTPMPTEVEEQAVSEQPAIRFISAPRKSLKPMEELFRRKVFNFLVAQKVLAPEKAQALNSWKNSGFSVHSGEVVPVDGREDLEHVVQYIFRNSFSVEKMLLTPSGNQIIYHSKINLDKGINPKAKGNFNVFDATDFIAAATQHIPEKGAQTVRYYGHYSNKARGMRKINKSSSVEICNTIVYSRRQSKQWRQLILRVWQVDPLCCPACSKTMRVVALFENPKVVEKVLRNRNAWRDPPGKLPPSNSSKEYAYEPCDDVDPRPDYESFGE